jgi:plastocyanin
MRLPTSLLVAGAMGLVGCGGGGDNVQGPDNSPEGDVLVQNNRFTPASLEVTSGRTVTWAWASGGAEHTVTFADETTSGARGSGTYARTFATAGDHSYRCTIHPTTMSGVVHVVAAPPGGGGGGGGGGDGGYPPPDPGGY